MTFSLLASFIVSCFVLAIAPGPDNIFVLTQSAQHGWRTGVLVCLGQCLGLLIQTTFLIVGLTAFIINVPILLFLLKFAGVLYLSYLAFQALTHARDSIVLQQEDRRTISLKPTRLLGRGMIMCLSNPKVQLFFLSFFPQFLPHDMHGTELILWMAILGFILSCVSLIVFSSVAFFSGVLTQQFTSVKFTMCLNYSAAFIFIALAIYTLYNALPWADFL